MSLGCAGCGSCCNPVKLAPEQLAKLQIGTDRNSVFAQQHWKPVGRSLLSGHVMVECDRFDPDTLLCTAHDDRPPICSGYPFYGRQPNPADLGSGHILDRVRGDPSLGCSYLLDIPPAWRPAGVRPLIPLTVA